MGLIRGVIQVLGKRQAYLRGGGGLYTRKLIRREIWHFIQH